jgi:hypothetical protein
MKRSGRSTVGFSRTVYTIITALLLASGCGGGGGADRLTVHDTPLETEYEEIVLSGSTVFGDEYSNITVTWENVTSGFSGPVDDLRPVGYTWTELDSDSGWFFILFPIFLPIAEGETHYEYDFHHWDVSVPLVGGENEIVITACENTCTSRTVFISRTFPPPGNIRTDTGDSRVTLFWEPIEGVDSYSVYWSTSPGFEISKAAVISSVDSTFTQDGLTNGGMYYYRVTSISVAGESYPSEEVAALAGAASRPLNVSAEVSYDQVVLSWEPSADVTSYNIYWSNEPGVSKTTGMKIADAVAPFYHSNLAGLAYYYVLTAVNAYRESSESEEVAAFVQVPPTVPTGFSVRANGLFSEVNITWREMPGAVSYNVSKCESSIDIWGNFAYCNPVLLTTVSGDNYRDRDVVHGKAYGYSMSATNEFGWSERTNTKYVEVWSYLGY